MAVDSEAKRFVGHPCCVQAILNVWYGMIDYDKTGWVWLLVTISTFGLSSSLTLSFRQNMPINLLNVRHFVNRIQ